MSETLDTVNDNPSVAPASEFDQLWRIATIANKDLMLDFSDNQKALKQLVLALIAAPIRDYEDDLEDGEDCNPMEWFSNAEHSVMNGKPIETLPYGWPEDVEVYGGSAELQAARAELARVKAELAAAKSTKAPKAPRKARTPKEPKEPKVAKERAPRAKKEKPVKDPKTNYTKIISYYVLTHSDETLDEMVVGLQAAYPENVTRAYKGEPRTMQAINPATVGLHRYLWRDKAADLVRAFPDQDWSMLAPFAAY